MDEDKPAKRQKTKENKKTLYCLPRCKNRKSGVGYMICCDKCDVWYHGKCVDVSREEEYLLDNWFCELCIKKAVQCANPDCINEVAIPSITLNGKTIKTKYCSLECGKAFNKLRYEKFFIPKYNELVKSIARANKLSEIGRLEELIEETHERIGQLKNEREDLERVISSIKEEATRLREKMKDLTGSAKESSADSNDSEDEDEESKVKQDRVIEQSKTFCITCGTEQSLDKAFKHWYQCHKKQESQYNFTSEDEWNSKLESKYDMHPKLYCEHKCEKKGKQYRYCLHVASACPQHSNWQAQKDEVCGCPLEVMQELRLDGENYCTELKSECGLHYNWDKFRLATKDMERIQEFSKLSELKHKQSQLTINLRDTHGGIVGIMLHETKDHQIEAE